MAGRAASFYSAAGAWRGLRCTKLDHGRNRLDSSWVGNPCPYHILFPGGTCHNAVVGIRNDDCNGVDDHNAEGSEAYAGRDAEAYAEDSGDHAHHPGAHAIACQAGDRALVHQEDDSAGTQALQEA